MNTDNKSPDKIYLETTIFNKIDYDYPITWGDIKDIELFDADVLSAGWDDGFISENNTMDGHFFLRIERWVIESDDEFMKRQNIIRIDNERIKKNRYETYLKLKKEFE